MLLAFARALLAAPLPRSIWIPGTILSIFTPLYAAVLGVYYTQPWWMEMPMQLLYLITIIYYGFALAKITGERFYGVAYTCTILMAYIFRFVSYEYIGQLYSDSESAKGTLSACGLLLSSLPSRLCSCS